MSQAATEISADQEPLWAARAGPYGDAARRSLFSRHAAFAKSVAVRQFRTRSRGDLELADLHQMACIGLLEAIDHYDPFRGVAFRAYATHRITGSIADGIAHSSELREQHSAQARLRRQRIRSLETSEPSGPTRSHALEQLAEIAIGLALGFMLEDTGIYMNDKMADNVGGSSPTAYQSAAWQELVSRLHSELAMLPSRERVILQQHYLDGIGFEVLASLHQISRGRVSQLHRAALLSLRRKLARHGQYSIQR